VQALGERLGHIALVVCLDSGAGNYDQLWLTTSLRGNITGTLKVEILTEGIHSGDASGLVPSSFRILRQVPRPPRGLEERPPPARQPALRDSGRSRRAGPGDRGDPRRRGLEALPVGVRRRRRARPCRRRPTRSRRSSTAPGGRRSRSPASTACPRSRTPATCCVRTPRSSSACARRRWSTPGAAAASLKKLLEDNAPYNAKVTFHADGRADAAGATGWNAPTIAPWLQQALDSASQAHFGAPVRLHRPGRHDPADEHAAAELPEGADDGLRRARARRATRTGRTSSCTCPYGKKLTAGGGAGDGGVPVIAWATASATSMPSTAADMIPPA
jgi:hypothetical protein